MRNRLTLAAALALSLTVGACSDDSPTSANTAPENEAPTLAPAPVATGPLVTTLTNFVVRNADGVAGVFNGTLTITRFAVDEAGRLVAQGTLVGTTTIAGVTTAVNETFTNLQVTPGRRCRILFLDVGPIFLDLLGLQVDVSRIQIDITAVAGPGNLLGNLLCALVGLLDRNPLAAAVTDLLNQINAILAG
jgi:hypothetical protein